MVDATDLKSVVRKGVRVRVPPSAPIGASGRLNHLIISAGRAPHCGSVAWGLSSVTQCLGNVNAADVSGVSQVSDGAGDA